MQGTTDLEESILSNQFFAGLLPSIKIKVAGTEGNFDDTLLTKARFEEAKLCENLGRMNLFICSKRQSLIRLMQEVGDGFH